ncbi:DUF2642 domain-containing protein [Paenibacillus sp. 481]|nr:DUF2642 domain-containing protein [Paenibacillus sp. 481]
MYPIDPYVVQTLQSVTDKVVVVETVRGPLKGKVKDVKLDHIVLQIDDHLFIIRIAQIVWVRPESK